MDINWLASSIIGYTGSAILIMLIIWYIIGAIREYLTGKVRIK